ncbi:MAG: BatA domain-containing protein [Planctomycetes bacterium]|nr:BatA domain-containing protein [Planctomycetota bacterium]
MSFLFPVMLAGLAGLGVPAILHLIARQRFPVLPFPSLRFLQQEERTNVFAWKLVDPWQLLLRLLVLLLLVLAMARLHAPWGERAAARNLVVVLDASSSMNLEVEDEGGRRVTLAERARQEARKLLSSIRPPSQCAVLVAGDSLRAVGLQPSPEEALAVLGAPPASPGRGVGIVGAVAAACQRLRGRREIRSQIVVLTDRRASAFGVRSLKDLEAIDAARKKLGSKLEIVMVDLAGSSDENLAITGGRLRGAAVRVGDEAHVVARVVNSSQQEKTASVRLAVGEREEPLIKTVSLGPGGEADVDLTARVDRSARTFAQARLREPDRLPGDDLFRLPLNVADARRILLVDGSREAENEAAGQTSPAVLGGFGQAGQPKSDAARVETVSGAVILRFALNPGRELGLAYGTGITTAAVTPEALSGVPLSQYEIIVLYDVSSLPETLLEDLDGFVRQGRSLLFFASRSCHALKFNRTFAASGPKRSAIAPARLGNEREFEPPLTLLQSGQRHPVLAGFRDPLQGDLFALRFMKARELTGLADGASVLLAAAGDVPLVVEGGLDRGRTVLFSFGLELDQSNFARTRVFPALLWRLVDYLTGQLDHRTPDLLTASTPGVLDVSEPSFALASTLELSSAAARMEATRASEAGRPDVPAPAAAPSMPIALPVSEDRTVWIPPLSPGLYQLHKPQQPGEVGGRVTDARYVAVNPDPAESLMARLDPGELTRLWGDSVRMVHSGEVLDLAPNGFELWPFLVSALVLAYAAEAGSGWWLTARRERQRANE